MFLRHALHSQRKGNLLMKEFLMKVKSYCDSLARCGEIISDHEHVTAILNGLSPKYESVIIVITASQVPYSVQGVTTMLLYAKARQQATVVDIPSSANVVTYQQVASHVDHMSSPVYQPFSIAGAPRGHGQGRSFASCIQF